MMIIVTCWIVLLVTTAVQGFPLGAPPSSCSNLLPQHAGAQLSADPIPYEVDMSEFICQSYIPAKRYNVTLRTLSSSNQEHFKGFIIQARTISDGSPVGYWQIKSPSLAKTVCSKNTAATHTNSNVKTSVILTWTAPPAGTGAIKFEYTFVKSFSKIWAKFATKAVQETDRIKCISSTPVKEIVTTTTSSKSATVVPSSTPPPKEIDPTNSSEDFSGDLPDSATITSTSTSSIKLSPTPTTAPILASCEDVTGYPLCSPDFCNSSRSKFARCSSRVDSCSDCQVTTCRVCVHTDHSVDLPKECVKEVCKNLRCVVQWSRCAYEKIQSYEMKKSDRKSENYKCFVPNCYKNSRE